MVRNAFLLTITAWIIMCVLMNKTVLILVCMCVCTCVGTYIKDCIKNGRTLCVKHQNFFLKKILCKEGDFKLHDRYNSCKWYKYTCVLKCTVQQKPTPLSSSKSLNSWVFWDTDLQSGIFTNYILKKRSHY